MSSGGPEQVTLNTVHEDLQTGFTHLEQEVRDGFAELKGEVRDGFTDLKGEVRGGFAELKSEVRGGFAELKSEVRDGFTDLKGELRGGFAELKGAVADLKITLITGFQALPTRESSEEMVRLLRERNRIDEERFTQLDVRIREQHLEIQQVLRAVVEGQGVMADGIRALVARLDALIRGRGDGSPTV